MNMKKLGIAMALIVGFSSAAYAEDLKFVLYNKSSVKVTGIQVSTVASGSWEENLIEGYVLPAGNNVDVVIGDGAKVCEYDIKVTFADSTTVDDRDVNLCDLGSYSVHD